MLCLMQSAQCLPKLVSSAFCLLICQLNQVPKHCFQLSTVSVRWDWSAGLAAGEQSASETGQSEVRNSSDEQPIPRRRRRVAAAAAPSSESDLEQESDPESGLADDSDSGAESEPDAASRPAKRPKKRPKKSTAR
jgi:hypothetical protein